MVLLHNYKPVMCNVIHEQKHSTVVEYLWQKSENLFISYQLCNNHIETIDAVL